MIEGLWVVRFVKPAPDEVDLLSGVVVIETNRVLGGDSGFVYTGSVGEKEGKSWPVTIRVRKHDERVEGFFSDEEDFTLSGRLFASEDRDELMYIELGLAAEPEMILSLTKVAELP